MSDNYFDTEFGVTEASLGCPIRSEMDTVVLGTDGFGLPIHFDRNAFEADGIRFAYVFYKSGLSINVMYAIDDSGKRAVGFKLSDGMDVPDELASSFKFARQKSKLAGTIRGSYFVIKGVY